MPAGGQSIRVGAPPRRMPRCKQDSGVVLAPIRIYHQRRRIATAAEFFAHDTRWKAANMETRAAEVIGGIVCAFVCLVVDGFGKETFRFDATSRFFGV